MGIPDAPCRGYANSKLRHYPEGVNLRAEPSVQQVNWR
jgi:hypothetical protein